MGVGSKIYPLVLKTFESVHYCLRNVPLVGLVFDKFTAFAACFLTGFSGYYAAPKSVTNVQPKKMLKLYSFVACPFCRKAEVALSVLGLDVQIFSCPRTTLKQYGSVENSRYRTEAVKIGGKAQFPLLVDENTNKVLYESSDIVNYLMETYGSKDNLPFGYKTIGRNIVLNVLRNLLRCLPEDGMLKTESKVPKTPFVLWGAEGCYSTLKARETLCTLEMTYIYKTIPVGAVAKRQEFNNKFGDDIKKSSWLPYILSIPPVLEDRDNRAVVVGGYAISKYLNENYKMGEVVNASWLSFSTKGATKGHMTL